MSARVETPYFTEPGFYAGDFHYDRSYTNWRPRGTPDWLMIYTVDGAGYLTTPSRQGRTRAGEVTLYTPGEYQDYKTDPAGKHWHLYWAHFIPKPSWRPWLRWPVGGHGVKSLHLVKGEIREGFMAAMRRMHRVVRQRSPNFADFAANALEEALLWAHLGASREDWARTDPRVRRAIDYLAANLREPFRLEVLARHCGLSVSRLAHLFKSETGASPQQFCEQQRMWEAGRLLQVTGLGIAEIAEEVGYEDPFYFSNRFRRYAGKSPTQFRLGKRRRVSRNGAKGATGGRLMEGRRLRRGDGHRPPLQRNGNRC